MAPLATNQFRFTFKLGIRFRMSAVAEANMTRIVNQVVGDGFGNATTTINTMKYKTNPASKNFDARMAWWSLFFCFFIFNPFWT